jgi:hypothetical protein
MAKSKKGICSQGRWLQVLDVKYSQIHLVRILIKVIFARYFFI